jgi:hypothetical protein
VQVQVTVFVRAYACPPKGDCGVRREASPPKVPEGGRGKGKHPREVPAKYPPKVPAVGRVKGEGGCGSNWLSLSIFEENGEGGPQGRVGFVPSPLGEGWVGSHPYYRAKPD